MTAAAIPRRPLVVGNWKMNGSAELVARMVLALSQVRAGMSDIDVVLSPPVVLVATLVEQLGSVDIGVAAQNCYAEPFGAFTGEHSAPMLKAAGCGYVIVGHSERRTLFGESDQQVADKCEAVLAAEMVPIVCVGETLAERKKGLTESVIYRQIDAIIAPLRRPQIDQIVVAYEPVWAIGTGVSANAGEAQTVHSALRCRLAEQGGGNSARILYGGSVKPENAVELLAMPDIDGGLIGGASLDPESFLNICQAASRLC